ncbi:hypothetical protein [uncultured Bosea sp.]|uniref:hypothetical protein n=1 Tax=uncultured Bosea sp. TaxID=211457 RepID=UPI0025D1DDF8|nr:hypothetical protein [uncultured Bosea sp.]
MALEKLNPAAPSRALAGLGSQISSPAIGPETIIPAIIVNRISQRFGVTVPHAATIAQLADLGPRETR